MFNTNNSIVRAIDGVTGLVDPRRFLEPLGIETTPDDDAKVRIESSSANRLVDCLSDRALFRSKYVRNVF
jgi:hypothetical protein